MKIINLLLMQLLPMFRKRICQKYRAGMRSIAIFISLNYIPWNVLLFHFSVRLSFGHRPFTVRSACAIRAFIVNRFAFCVHRSLVFTVQKSVHLSLTVRSSTVEKAFNVHSAFSLHFFSDHWRSRSWNEKNMNKALKQRMFKVLSFY